jgi:hypothetical protein
MADRSSRRPHRRRWPAVTLLTLALVLGGCSAAPAPTQATGEVASSASSGPAKGSVAGGAPSATTSSSAQAGAASQSDLVLSRSGDFGVVPPEAWAEATDRAEAVPGLDLVLLSSHKVAGFGTNLVVLISAGDDASVRTELTRGREQMAADGRAIADTPDKQVAGSTASGFESSFEQQGVRVVARSYGLSRSGKVYLLTLSSAAPEAAHALTELDEILASWTWS